MLAPLILADGEANAAGYLALLLASCIGAAALLLGIVGWAQRSPDERSRTVGIGLLILLAVCILLALRLLRGPSFLHFA